MIALLLGPVLAVMVTRYIDQKREDKRRKWELLRDLMGFRRDPISQRFVHALNLLEVEFHNDKEVLGAWNALLQHYSMDQPKDDAILKAHDDKSHKLRAILIQKVAFALGIKLDSLEMFQSGYFPVGWENIQSEDMAMKQLLGQVLHGDRALQVEIKNLDPPRDE